MNHRRKIRTERRPNGFALAFTIFMVVALETTIAGSFLNMMRHQREAQRAADRVRAVWVGEAVIDRALKLLKDEITTNNGYPAVRDDDDDGLGGFNDAEVQMKNGAPFSFFLQNWYGRLPGSVLGQANAHGGFRHRLRDGRGHKPLDTVEVTAVSVRETQRVTIPFPSRRYRISVRVNHQPSNLTTNVTQEVLVATASLFDFSVFYNEDLEIAAGPDFTLQGPIFSNKNVYLMNDNGSTLNLLYADDFTEGKGEDYILSSADPHHIYFLFKRAIAKNYLLANNTYREAVRSYYLGVYDTLLKSMSPYDHMGCSESGDDCVELDVITSGLYRAGKRLHPPLFYYFKNEADFMGLDGGRLQFSDNYENRYNRIKVEGNQLSPYHPRVMSSSNIWPFGESWISGVFRTDPDDSSVNLSTDSEIYNGSKSQLSYVSISSAVDPNDLPKPDTQWMPGNPVSVRVSGELDPPTNPNWANRGTAFQNLRSGEDNPKTIPIGDPSNSSGPHLLIEPVSDSDSPSVRAAKFQSQADINIDCAYPCDDRSSLSEDFAALIDSSPAVIRTDGNGLPLDFYDYRAGAGSFRVLEIDIERLLAASDYESKMNSGKGVIMYIRTFPLNQAGGGSYQPHFVKLVNGGKLPKHGFTVVTNGRLWIQGNYNTFDYSKLRDCQVDEWTVPYNPRLPDDSNRCHVPSAAIFSDSFGVLSNQWSNTYAASTTLKDRVVSGDVMVNTALATGFLQSQLKEIYSGSKVCADDMSDCEKQPLDYGFSCAGGLKSDGQPNDVRHCQYYRGSDGIYYVNKESDDFKNAASRAGELLPDGDSRENNDGIPIFTDAVYVGTVNIPPTIPIKPYGVRPFVGVHFAVLSQKYLFGNAAACTTTCPDDMTTIQCEVPAGEETTSCNSVCAPAHSQTTCTSPPPPRVKYVDRYYFPLYEAKYSGGLENLINFQESWTGRQLRLLGTLSSPWFSKELTKDESPLYYGTSYYSAPVRDYQFNEDLKYHPPPGTPGVFSIKRKTYVERDN